MKLLRESRIRARWICALLLTALPAMPAMAQHVKDDPARLRLEAASAAKEGKVAPLEITPKTHVCDHFGAISCGQTLNATLTNQDCDLNDGSFIDFWELQGTSGRTVTVTLTSSQTDSYLFLFDPDSNAVAQSDSGGGGTNARITYTLNATGAWAIGANAAPGETGNYTLSLTCSGTGGGNVPAAPSNLRATALSSTEVDLEWNDNSNNETGFRVEGRAGNGAFTDLGGVSANATGAVITNLDPGTVYTFRVRARNASGDSPYSNQATVTTPGGGGGGDGFITSPAFPDFRFRVRITPQGGSEIIGARETACIPETLCVSGAVPGRSEVFLRVIGPRPNGFLWPTIVRFTPSQVQVEIQQISTGVQKTYFLAAVPPNSDDLSGLQDREGFLP
jgi:Fibronectin type III domain/Bacterial pre-peptidase C-terminal domain